MCLTLKFHVMATGDQYITQGTELNHANHSLLCRAIKRQQSSLNSAEHAGFAQQFRELGYKLLSFLKKIEPAVVLL